MMECAFSARLWEYEGQGSWHFLTLPKDVSRELRAFSEGRRKVGGTLRVTVRVGSSRWKTSLFWDTKRAAFLLPVKAAVRTKEQLVAGQRVEAELVAD
jgi:hypothetical protein